MLLLLIALMFGCQAELNPPICESETGVINEGWIVLWEGHSYRWRDLSHRIAFLRAGVALPAEDGSFYADLGILGGSWADGRNYRDHPSYELSHRRVRAQGLVAWYGEEELLIEPDGSASLEVEVDLTELELPSRDRWAVALRGICMDMDIPLLPGYDGSYSGDEGWTPQGFGANLSATNVNAKEQRAHFTVNAHFQPGRLDRVHHNQALEFARIATHVRYTLLGFNDGALQHGLVEASAFYPSRGRIHSDIEPIPEEELRLNWQGAPDLPNALPLLRGFDIDLNASTDTERPGRYLREWAAQLEGFSYERETGRAQALIDGYVSHSSLIQEGDLEVDFHAEVDLLQLADPFAEFHQGRVAGEQPVLGTWSHPVDPIEE